METKDLGQLNIDPTNPRQISKTDFENLKKSIVKFGDISGIVFNVRTQQLVGGHQRYEAFQRLDGAKHVEIVQRLQTPTAKGTVAIGFVQLDGERYAYREVDWSESMQKAANIAANRISGEWDLEKLGQADQWLLENAPELMEYTGQDQDEINQLLGNSPEPEAKDEDPRIGLNLKLTEHQQAVVLSAIQNLKAQRNLQNEGNEDMDANAIFYICQNYLENLQSNQA